MSRTIIKIKAVIFDMDGVITNTMPDHYKSWSEVLKSIGIHATYDDIYKREGQPGLQSVKELSKEYNIPYSEIKAKKLLLEKEELFKKIVRVRYIIGTRKLIRDLHREGFDLALVTGTAHHEMKRMLPEAFQGFFKKAIVTGNDVKHGKPHPEPFNRALEKLQIKPNQGVVIENAPFGIRSAKAAGLKCLALETSLPKKHLFEADHIFEDVKSLRRQIEFRKI